MIVYVFRHGHAENTASSPDRTDKGRRMVAEWREQVKWACENAKGFGLVPDVIMSSPRVRGKQTAEMVRDLMNPNAKLLTDDSLEPEAKVGETYRALAKLGKADSVVRVTHLPHLGHLLADMLDCKAVWHNLDFENGAMARVDFKGLPKPKKGNLVWIISPARSA